MNNYEEFAASTHTATNEQQTANKRATCNQQQYNKYNKNKNNKKNNMPFFNYSEHDEDEHLKLFKAKSLFND